MWVDRLTASLKTEIATSDALFGDIDSRREDMNGKFVDSDPELLARMYENIALAIAGRQSLLIPAAEAADAVEFGNAILLSSATSRSVDLPIDRAAYEAFISAKTGCTLVSNCAASA
jgi:hypothetical protein